MKNNGDDCVNLSMTQNTLRDEEFFDAVEDFS